MIMTRLLRVVRALSHETFVSVHEFGRQSLCFIWVGVTFVLIYGLAGHFHRAKFISVPQFGSFCQWVSVFRGQSHISTRSPIRMEQIQWSPVLLGDAHNKQTHPLALVPFTQNQSWAASSLAGAAKARPLSLRLPTSHRSKRHAFVTWTRIARRNSRLPGPRWHNNELR